MSLFAPGDNILGLSNGKAVYKSGTSMSSPHIVGIAAMIYEKYPGIEQKSMKNILLNMAINNTLNSFKMTTSPLLELRGFKNDSTIKCSSLVKYACSKTPTCTYFKYYGCRAVNFCGFRTKKECLSRKRCKFIGKCKII